MKKLFVKSAIFAAAVAIIFTGYIKMYLNGASDDFYLRFVSGPYPSLILGSSRAAQGIVPSVLNDDNDPLVVDKPIYNFSFTLFSSAWSPVYLKAIEKKVLHSTKNGIFILEINPFNISRRRSNKNDDAHQLEGRNSFVNIRSVTMDPNWEYVLKHYKESYYRIILRNFVKSKAFLQDDGWLEITIENQREYLQTRKPVTLAYFQNIAEQYTYSPTRLLYLTKTIEFLKRYGSVYLVRLPVDPDLMSIETKYMGDFDVKIAELVSEKSVHYFNFSNDMEKYTTVDANHLYKESAKKLTRRLKQQIKYDLETERALDILPL